MPQSGDRMVLRVGGSSGARLVGCGTVLEEILLSAIVIYGMKVVLDAQI